MKKLQYSVDINAPKEKVWEVLWNDETYRKWTSVFSEGSSAETDWQEGSKIHFLNGEGGGMYSVVAKNQPNEYMSIKHLGEVKDGKEQPISEEVESWSGSMENYRLTQQGNTTNLSVELDTVESFEDFMNQTFPKALEKVKELAETN